MSYRDQLRSLQEQRTSLNRRIRDREVMYGSIMSDEARAWNNAHDNIRSMYYDREIAKIEKLAQKELEDEIVDNVMKRLNRDIKIDTTQFEREMKKVMKDLGFK